MKVLVSKNRKNMYRLLLVSALTIICILSIYYFHAILEVGTVFTHFFYIPIILAAIWWKRNGLWLACFLALTLILSHIFFRTEVITVNDYLRAFLLLAIASVVAFLSEKIAKVNLENEKIIHEVREYIKEINCLYKISAITEDPNNLTEGMLNQIVAIIPSAMQDPELACAKIVYGKQIFQTNDYIETGFSIQCSISVNNKPSGYIKVCYRDEKEGDSVVFRKEERMLLSEISERTGKIIERYQTKYELIKLQRDVISISEEERQRIGHDLHDGLGQLLTGASFVLRSAKKKIGEKQNKQIKELDELSRIIKDAAIFCRQLSKGLPTENIEHDGLLHAVDQLSNDLREVYGINCTLATGGNIEIKDNFVASQLYRIIQESVTNAIRHGEAKNISIYLSSEIQRLSLKILDDGKGISNTRAGKGMGINIMKYRADLIGAQFSAENNPDGGFLVSVTISDISEQTF